MDYATDNENHEMERYLQNANIIAETMTTINTVRDWV